MFAAQPAGSITQSGGVFTLVSPGTYQVTAILNIPPTTNLTQDLYLLVNGAVDPSTRTHIRTTADVGSHVIQTFEISDGTTTVALASSEALDLTAADATDVLASISFLRLN